MSAEQRYPTTNILDRQDQILYKDIYELIWAFPSLTASSREGYEIPGEGYEIPGEGYEILSIWG